MECLEDVAHTGLLVLWLGNGNDSFLGIDDAQFGSSVLHADGRGTVHQHLKRGQPFEKVKQMCIYLLFSQRWIILW